jgi:cytochrome P450
MFHPLDPRHADDPFGPVAEMHRNGSIASPMPRCRVVAGDADVRAVLRNPAAFSSHATTGETDRPDAELALSQLDPPAHTRVRRAVSDAFAPRAVSRAESQVREHARRAAAAVWRGIDGGRAVDLVREVTDPLPIEVLADFLGLAGADRERLTGWVGEFTSLVGPRPEPAWPEFCERVDDWVRARRLASRTREDLLDALAHGPLSDVEIRAFVHFLVVAGVRNVGFALGNALYRLLFDGRWGTVCTDPSSIAAVIEESLRLDPPVLWSMRTTTGPTTLGGTHVDAGERIFALAVGANLDPNRWEEPTAFRPDRPALRSHVAFGHGPHACLGAGLTRLQLRVALEELALAAPDMALAPGFRLRKAGDLMARGPATLPVVAR